MSNIEKQPLQFTWPEESKGYVDFHQNVILLYGIPKIGKTTLASNFPDALFFDTERGTKHQKIKGWYVSSWTDFLMRLDMLETANRLNEIPFKTIIIDTVDRLIDYCEQFICNKLGINVLSDVEFGKAHSQNTKEFRKQLNRIISIGLGLVFVSHATEKEIQIGSVVNPYAPIVGDFQTGKVKMTIPTLEKRAYEYIAPVVDMILYMEVDRDINRVLRTQPTKSFEAGDRSGRLSANIMLGKDPSGKEGFTNILNAYYGNSGNKEAVIALIERVNIAEQYMAEKKIDGFDVPTRVTNSRKKYLKVEIIENAKVTDLELYLQHLRIKAKKKGNGKNEVPSSE